MITTRDIRYHYFESEVRIEGNYLVVYRFYFILCFIPIWVRRKIFNEDNAIWLANSVFGMGNDHNIERAFNETKKENPRRKA